MKILPVMLPVFLFSIVSDQASKVWAVQTLGEKSIEVIPDLFSLTLAYNRGAAFGFLGDLPDGVRQIALGAATVLALGTVLFMLLKYHRQSIWGCLSIGMILGGAVGNIIDRVRLGMVIDFLDVYWGEYHWPTFNIADSCICVGVTILIFLKTEASPEPVVDKTAAF